MNTLAHQPTTPETPTSTKPDAADCCVTCGRLLDVEATLLLFTDGRACCGACA